MFESIEAARGRWIGPKPWNRINTNFLNQNGTVVTDHGYLGVKLYIYLLNHLVIEIRPGMAVKCGFTR